MAPRRFLLNTSLLLQFRTYVSHDFLVRDTRRNESESTKGADTLRESIFDHPSLYCRYHVDTLIYDNLTVPSGRYDTWTFLHYITHDQVRLPVYVRLKLVTLFIYDNYRIRGANTDRKSTTGGCQFLGSRLCKKQTSVSTSTAEAEYIAAASCCSQVLWIQNQMLDYGLTFLNTPIYIDNSSAISIVNNPVKHSKTKHIEIRFHFIRDCNEKKLIQQLADLFTKSFDIGRFIFFITNVGMINPE
ncbi:hypothetical protein OSB04_006001 [Centaurea solstitialis]|uniref:Uncharacterized protein n=1 Tax=Centaurea solstitialis TaxID=347529 RepID=A0AA38WSE8_9ASTR|nr:hypothetical protein OSB04_006001 [Centaurea solstitialis]